MVACFSLAVFDFRWGVSSRGSGGENIREGWRGLLEVWVWMARKRMTCYRPPGSVYYFRKKKVRRSKKFHRGGTGRAGQLNRCVETVYILYRATSDGCGRNASVYYVYTKRCTISAESAKCAKGLGEDRGGTGACERWF